MKTLCTIILYLAVAAMASTDDVQLENLLYEGNNKFTARMFGEVAKSNTGKSFVLSAYSVLTPLAQLSLASVDESHDELLETIGMPNDNVTKQVFSVVNTKVRTLKGITLKTASKIYVADNFKLNNQFALDTRTTFGSEVQSMNFVNSQKAADEVNAWVEEQTNNRIKELVSPDILSADTKALLVNAIYFKGLWKSQFDKTLTRESPFFVNKDVTKQVRMMSQKGYYKYAESHELKSQIIEIPYEGEESSLVIVLPLDKLNGFDEVEKILEDPQVLKLALNNMYETEVDMQLPAFKIETKTDLKEILINMNVQKIFDPVTAKLYKLLEGTSDLYISTATQKAFIEVNEEGAEATAANAFGVSYVSSVGFEPEVIKFVADHPFFFFLRGGQYTLFNGAYYTD